MGTKTVDLKTADLRCVDGLGWMELTRITGVYHVDKKNICIYIM